MLLLEKYYFLVFACSYCISYNIKRELLMIERTSISGPPLTQALMILYTTLILSAKNFPLQPWWRVFLIFLICTFKHPDYIDYIQSRIFIWRILFGYHGQRMILYTTLILSAKNFPLQPCWRVFLIFLICTFKHPDYIDYIQSRIFIWRILFGYHGQRKNSEKWNASKNHQLLVLTFSNSRNSPWIRTNL